jgi:hypothetical protein
LIYATAFSLGVVNATETNTTHLRIGGEAMKLNRKRRQIRFESLEQRKLLAADLGLNLPTGSPESAMPTAEIHFVELGGGHTAAEYDGTSFVADSFSFGVEREMKESGEKGGTEDINIGVGELQECTISKSQVDQPGAGEIQANRDQPSARVFVKSWSTSGDADDRPTEEVAFYYNRIAP